MDIRDLIARNVRRLRHAKGLSQEALADAADINRTYVSKLETARTYAGAEVIEKLAKTFGVEPAELLVSPRGHRKVRRAKRD
jgi:transcriptional regulator with XRE-family HTH domain